jgi:hypothetical protein
MADQKISQLSAATTPVAGTEVLPFVQSGTTKKVSIAQLLPGLGTIPTTQGGTGLTSFTNKGIPYATSTSALTTGTALVFDGTNLGVGTSTPDKNVTIANPATGVPTLKLSGFADGTSGIPYAIINFFNEDGSQAGPNNAAAIKALNASTDGSGGQLGFFTSPTDAAEGADAVERLRLNSVGDANLINGNLIIGTSGKGIDFSATPGTGTSELLADYEEGTWTPSVGGSATYAAANSGRYTRIGNVVHVEGILEINVLGTGSVLDISGLPFTSNASNPGGAVTVGYWAGMSTPLVYLAGAIANNSSVISMRYAITSATSLSFAGVFANGSRIDFTGSYTV